MVRSTNSTTSSKSSVFIALALAIGALYFGRQIFIPLALALVLSFLLTPLVSLLERGHLRRLPAVLVVLIFCFALTAGAGWEVAGQLLDITGHFRDYKENVEETIRSLRPPASGAFGQATATVEELNKELAAAPGQAAAAHEPNQANGSRPNRPLQVQVTTAPTNLVQDLHALLGPLAAPAETATIVVIFVAFMLIKREDLRNRLIRLGGQGQLTVMTQALDEASQRLGRYLLLQFLVNAGYGLVFGVGLFFIGVPHALLWGILSALMRLVPYVGTLIATAFPMAMALAVFPGWQHAALIFGRHVERLEQHQKYKDVVDRQRQLDDIARNEFGRLCSGGVRTQCAIRVPPDQSAEAEREAHPGERPPGRLTRPERTHPLSAE